MFLGSHNYPNFAKGLGGGGRDIAIRDNLQSHTSPGIRDAIEPRGADLRLLPPYPPHMNPIEQVFTTLKTPIRAGTASIGRVAQTKQPPTNPGQISVFLLVEPIHRL